MGCYKGIYRKFCFCNLCNSNSVEDKFHLMFLSINPEVIQEKTVA